MRNSISGNAKQNFNGRNTGESLTAESGKVLTYPLAAGTDEQTFDAARPSIHPVTAARHAMSDPRLSSKLNIDLPPKTYAQLKAEFANEAGGKGSNVLYEKIIKAAKQQVKELGCFVAGTLVHTQEGLRPIEQIKVGDYVLSKPESGEGEQSYQRVTRTFEYEDREVYFAAWIVEDRVVPRAHPVDFSKLDRGYAVVTGGHPFRVNQITTCDEEGVDTDHEVNAWMNIEAMIQMDQDSRLKGGGIQFRVELADGRIALLWKFEVLLQHSQPDLGIAFKRDPRAWDLRGTAVRFTENGPTATHDCNGWSYVETFLNEDDAIEYDYDDENSLVTQSTGFLPMLRKVYNIEVENTHTYFVGEMGVWVHNISGIVEKILTRNPAKNVGVYIFEKDRAAFHADLGLQL